MVDLTAEMAQLWASLGPPPPGPARVAQFIAARSGEGVSTVAREFARFAAERTRGAVWLVDLDFADSAQYRLIASQPGRFGPLGAATAASPDRSCFFTIQPPARDPQGHVIGDTRYLIAHPVGRSKLWVTRFRREMIRPGQAVRVVKAPDYWNALRANAELVVVDAPAVDRATTGLALAPFMDFSIMVVSEDRADTAASAALKTAIEQEGGRCAGLVFNRASLQPPGFLKGLLR